MRFDTAIELIASGGYDQDSMGQQIEAAPQRRTVYANEFDMSHAEFYGAGAVGLKPEVVFQIRSCEYQGEKRMVASGIEYRVIRARRKGEWVMLTGGSVIGDGQ